MISRPAQDRIAQVAVLLDRLIDRPIAVDDQPVPPEDLVALGLDLVDGQVSLPQGVDLLDSLRIRRGLSDAARQWLKRLEVFSAIGSTNSWMMDGLADASLGQTGLGGLVALAECQISGRGRRGRAWQSPLGANLALSLGFSLPLPVSQLGGLSLVVGMAAVDALDPGGHYGLKLKWPNDLLLDGRKLAGILVEVAHRDATSEVCVGIGVNWAIPAGVRSLIDQPVAEVQEFAPGHNRSDGANLLISRIVEFVFAFAESGFATMAEHYDNIHAFHGQNCRLIKPDGDIEGEVLGVSDTGDLRLLTSDGVRTFSSGEVSLRPQ